ncbi:MAG: non-hydrolyzing UDP-N-acetylglucosamine 2-epimerase [Gemmatimonadota bacterium]
MTAGQAPLRIVHVVGTRPDFVKIAPVMAAFARTGSVEQQLVHTGQHYDETLSRHQFRDLGLPRPDINLGVGSATHAVQTARVMMAFEPFLRRHAPDWVVAVGDVNSTLAAALVTAKLPAKLAHIGAGMRSGEWRTPEEVNRILTDRLSDALFASEPAARENLRLEGVPEHRIHPVGNVLIDTLDRFHDRARNLGVHEAMGLEARRFALATIHRPGNVDDATRLTELLEGLGELPASCGCPVIFPMHPRTAERIRAHRLGRLLAPLQVVEPLPYLDFVSLMGDAGVAITDSGGVQEETSVLGTPCITLRATTERPVTVTSGTNRLLGDDASVLPELVLSALRYDRTERRPPLWDGRAAQRIARVILSQSPAERGPVRI